jgi:MYXO-CTERM domain-containing protein
MRRLWVVILVGALLVAAAIWSGAEASAPGIVQLVYVGFLMLFGATLAAGVRRRGRRRELFNRVKGGER